MIINEKTSSTFIIEFYDENGTAISPETASYSLHDVQIGTEIIAETQILNISSSVEIEISREENRIINDANVKETRSLTIEYNYRNSKGELKNGGSVEFFYEILNLKFVK